MYLCAVGVDCLITFRAFQLLFNYAFLLFVRGIVVLCNELLHLISTGHPLHVYPIVTMYLYCASEESSGY